MDKTYNWQFRTIDPKYEYPAEITERILDVFHDGFGIEGWNIHGIQKALHNSTVFGLLLGPKQEIAGYALYLVPEQTLQDKGLLWENAICIKKFLQNSGFGGEALKLALSIFSNHDIGWIGGRTQNPTVMKRYSKVASLLLPFDITYPSKDGEPVFDFLMQNVPEVFETKVMDPNGICKGVYHEGTLGDYTTDVAGTEEYERLLKKWGFSRKDGDAVIVVAKIPG